MAESHQKFMRFLCQYRVFTLNGATTGSRHSKIIVTLKIDHFGSKGTTNSEFRDVFKSLIKLVSTLIYWLAGES